VDYQQARLLLRRGDAARARPRLARGLAILRRLSDGGSPDLRAQLAPGLAWFAAATGDRAGADRALAVSPPRTPPNCGTHRAGSKTRA
jgi:hypothetical protein